MAQHNTATLSQPTACYTQAKHGSVQHLHSTNPQHCYTQPAQAKHGSVQHCYTQYNTAKLSQPRLNMAQYNAATLSQPITLLHSSKPSSVQHCYTQPAHNTATLSQPTTLLHSASPQHCYTQPAHNTWQRPCIDTRHNNKVVNTRIATRTAVVQPHAPTWVWCSTGAAVPSSSATACRATALSGWWPGEEPERTSPGWRPRNPRRWRTWQWRRRRGWLWQWLAPWWREAA